MYKKIITSLAAVMLICSAVLAAEAETYTISAYGEGRASAAPDTASITLSVKNSAPDAKSADTANAKRARAVIEAVKNLGVSDKDIKTSRYSIYPSYSTEKNGQRRITGYFAENSVTVRVREIKNTGAIIDSALNAGANQVSSINFYKEDTSSLEKEALSLAVKDARDKAEAVARALGVRIIGIKHASPNINRRSFEASRMMMKSAANSMSDSTPIESGSMEITASVNVDFIIK